jgi:hypothetical protein
MIAPTLPVPIRREADAAQVHDVRSTHDTPSFVLQIFEFVFVAVLEA